MKKKMEDKINIGGVWYVKEKKEAPLVVDSAHYEGIVWDTANYCFDATRLYRDDGSLGADIDIKFTDKRNQYTEVWDNINWFRGVLENNELSQVELNKIFGNDPAEFIAFLQHLKERKWL